MTFVLKLSESMQPAQRKHQKHVAEHWIILNSWLYVILELDRFIEKCAHQLTSVATFCFDENENFELLKRFLESNNEMWSRACLLQIISHPIC
jgi:hypothetical protein